MEIVEKKIYENITMNELILENHRYSIIKDCIIKTIKMFNCQNCVVVGNTVGTLLVDDKIPVFEGRFKKRKAKKFRKKYGSQNNFIICNIGLGDRF